MDFVVTVSAPIEVRINRATRRDNCSRDQIVARINNQMSDQQREELADFIITTDDKKLLMPQVLSLHKLLIDRIP